MVAMNKGKSPFLINLTDITDANSHQYEIKNLDKKMTTNMNGFNYDLEAMIRELINPLDPSRRGQI